MVIDHLKAQEEYLSVLASASYLGIGRTTLYSLMGSGALPYCKVGGRTIFRRQDLDDYMEETLVRGR